MWHDVTVFIEFHLIQNLNWCRKLWIFVYSRIQIKMAKVSSVRTTVPQAKLKNDAARTWCALSARGRNATSHLRPADLWKVIHPPRTSPSLHAWKMHIVQVYPNIPWVSNDSEIRNDHILAGWCKRYIQNCHEMNHVQYDLRKRKNGACCPGNIQDYPSTYHESCAIVTHVLHRHASWSVAPSSASDKPTNHAKLVKWLDLPRSKNSKQSLHHPIQGVVLKLKNRQGPMQNNSHNKDCSHCSSTHHVRSWKLPWAAKKLRGRVLVAWNGCKTCSFWL